MTAAHTPAPSRSPVRRVAGALVAAARGQVVPPLGLRRTLGRIVLGLVLAGAGTLHLTVAREEFQAQVPSWFPADPDAVVVASGIVEIGLGVALLVAPRSRRAAVGLVTAAFFVAVFPGNVNQLVTRSDAFGLDSDTARALRLPFQPLLVLWALWSTGAWRAFRDALSGERPAA